MCFLIHEPAILIHKPGLKVQHALRKLLNKLFVSLHTRRQGDLDLRKLSSSRELWPLHFFLYKQGFSIAFHISSSLSSSPTGLHLLLPLTFFHFFTFSVLIYFILFYYYISRFYWILILLRVTCYI